MAAALLGLCAAAGASGLQVAPVGLTFGPGSEAKGLSLSNTSDEPLYAQIRVMHWTQDDGKDQLQPTQALLTSPPMVRLPPGARHLVRVIRTQAASNGVNEEAFRVLVDELPPAKELEETGVRYVMRYSVPVFVQAFTSAPEVTAVAAGLSWSLVRDGNGVALQVRNAGNTHAQISAPSLLPPGGQPIELSPGLLGYVLPDKTMRWTVDVPAAQLVPGTQLKATINGKQLDQTFPVGDLSH